MCLYFLNTKIKMNKTAKIIVGVVLIVALIAGGIYFSGLAGDTGQGFLKKKNFTIDYDKKVKKEKELKSTDGIYMPKIKPENSKPVEIIPLDLTVPKLPAAPKNPEPCSYDGFSDEEKAQLEKASVPCSYAEGLRGWALPEDIVYLWKARVSLEYAKALWGKFPLYDIKVLWKAGVSLEYAEAMSGFWSDTIVYLWKAGVPLEYAMNAFKECGNGLDVVVIERAYKNGLAVEDIRDITCSRFDIGDPLPPMS